MSDTVTEGLYTLGVRFDDLVCDGVTCEEKGKYKTLQVSQVQQNRKKIYNLTSVDPLSKQTMDPG